MRVFNAEALLDNMDAATIGRLKEYLTGVQKTFEQTTKLIRDAAEAARKQKRARELAAQQAQEEQRARGHERCRGLAVAGVKSRLHSPA